MKSGNPSEDYVGPSPGLDSPGNQFLGGWRNWRSGLRKNILGKNYNTNVMENPKVKIDSYEHDGKNKEFKYPKGKEYSPKINPEELVPDLIKAFKEGISDKYEEDN